MGCLRQFPAGREISIHVHGLTSRVLRTHHTLHRFKIERVKTRNHLLALCRYCCMVDYGDVSPPNY